MTDLRTTTGVIMAETMRISSHLMAEMALTADHLIVIGQGRLKAAMSVAAPASTAARNGGRYTSRRSRSGIHVVL